MQICLFSYRFLPDVGGVQETSATLASAWTAAGHNVTVVTHTPLESDRDFDRQYPFTVVRLNPTGNNADLWKPILKKADLIVNNALSLRYWTQWKWSRKPIFFVHAQYLGLDSTEKGISWRECTRRRWNLAWRRCILRMAAGNIFISDHIRRAIGVANGIVIYNSIDGRFRPLTDVPITSDFTYFGRMSLEKGITDLLDALHACKAKGHRFTLDMYGDGPMTTDFKRKAAELRLEDQVRWFPFARGEELVRAMNSAAVVVVPSAWIEPMGIVAVEAMACGKCVIGSASGGLGEVLAGFCPTFPNHDSQQLATQMIAVMTDPALRKRYEEAALRRSKDFLAQKIAQDYIDYFRSQLKI
jgi:glycogen(starch) synthase